jgi:hypothetical protein
VKVEVTGQGSIAALGPERLGRVELVIAANPDPDSRLPYLMRLPLAGGMVFRTAGTFGELAALPRAATVIEDRYSALLKLNYARPSPVADGLAELQVCWPNVPIVFCETRALAEEWTYRFLAAAQQWALTEHAALGRLTSVAPVTTELTDAPQAPEPSTAEVPAWARATGLTVPDRGRLRPDIWDAWRTAHPSGSPDPGGVGQRDPSGRLNI